MLPSNPQALRDCLRDNHLPGMLFAALRSASKISNEESPRCQKLLTVSTRANPEQTESKGRARMWGLELNLPIGEL